MSQKSRPMDDADLAAIIDEQIHDSIEYNDSELARLREKALLYFEGDETLAGDVPLQPNRSSVVSHDLSDTHGWIMPSLLRVFLSSDRVVVYEPRRQGTEEEAKQATDLVNYVFLNECNGYAVLHSGIWDGLNFGNGLVKHWWDDTKEYKTETLSGLPEAEYIRIVSDPNVEEVLEHTERDDPMYAPRAILPAPEAPGAIYSGPDIAPPVGDAPIGDGPPVATDQVQAISPGSIAGIGGGEGAGYFGIPKLHDLKIKRCVSRGRIRIVAIPPEEFRLDRNAVMLDEEHVRFAAHVCLRTRSSLIEDGYDREAVDELPANSGSVDSAEASARDRGRSGIDTAPDKSTELIEVWECYVQVDYDGDGVAEWRRVVTADGRSKRSILANEEWGDDLPFSDIVPNPIPHRWRGRSLYEDIADLQQIKTVFLRGINNNLYQVNNPQREAVRGAIDSGSIDELLNPTFGGTVWVNTANAIRDLSVPFIADKLLSGMELADQIREFRTGVSASTMALDPEALANQTATAVQARTSASFSKIETYARNISDYRGLKRIFSCVLKLIVKNQDQARTIRLRGEWVEMDPRGWDADMDVIINVGLGSGSRDRDVAGLQVISNEQKLIIANLGPIVAAKLGIGPDKVFETNRKMVEALGLKSPEQYFPEITSEQVNQIIQEMGSQEKPDPKVAESQAKIQLMQMEAQARLQADQQKMAADAQAQQQQAALDWQHKQELGRLDWQHKQQQSAIDNEHRAREIQMKGEAMLRELEMKHQLAAEEAQRTFVLKQQEMQANVALKQRELEFEAALKREQLAQQPQAPVNIQQAEE